MLPTWPLVSVIVTNYNYAQYIEATINSVLAQDYPNFECIVIDDCSNDDSFEVINKYAARIRDPRLRHIRLGANLGQMGAMSAGFENSSGDFIHFVDADDLLMPNFLSVHIAAHLNSSFSASLTDIASALIKPVLRESIPEIVRGRLASAPPRETPIHYVDRALDGWHGVATTAFLFRRDVIDAILPSRVESMRICADYYFVKFAHCLGGTLVIGRALSFFRLHKKNNFSSNGVIGGPHSPATVAPGGFHSIEKQIGAHLLANINKMSGLIGMEYCLVLIRKTHNRLEIYEASKDSSLLKSRIGGGKEWLFDLKLKAMRRFYWPARRASQRISKVKSFLRRLR